MEVSQKMRRFAIAVLTLAGIAAAGTAFALFQGQALEGKIADSRSYASLSEIEPVRVATASGRSSGGCGSASGGCGSTSSGCGSSAGRGSCCSQGASDAATTALRTKQIRSYLVDYYTKALGEGISVQVRDLGCHQEADILRADKVIKRLSIRGRAVTEIT